MKGLDIGPRDVPVKGFDTLDCESQWCTKYSAHWGYEVLPFVDDTYDVVYTSHVLQFIPWQRTEAALREVWRILKPGGAIEIWVPDFDYIMDCDNCHDSCWEWTLEKLYGTGDDDNWHKSVFGFEQLEGYLRKSGFGNVKRKEVSRGFDHGKISMGVTAVKTLGDQDV